MELHRAIDQISEIRAQLWRGQIFRGYRSGPMAATSGLAVVTAAAHALFAPRDDLTAIALWTIYAGTCGIVCGIDLLRQCARGDRHQRAQTRQVVSQFVPSLVLGAVVTAALWKQPDWRALLPGLWTSLFALGVFAQVPYLTRRLRGVAVWYQAAGFVLLGTADPTAPLSPIGLGVTFGLGQAFVAWLLLEEGER